MSILIRCTAMIVVLCVGLGVVPVGAEEMPGPLHTDAEPTPFVLLPDRALESAGTENEEAERKSRDWLGLGRDTVFLLGYQTAFIGALYFLPESVTHWSSEDKKISFEKWWDHVQHPVLWDKDNPLGNYVGHPYVGRHLLHARPGAWVRPNGYQVGHPGRRRPRQQGSRPAAHALGLRWDQLCGGGSCSRSVATPSRTSENGIG